MLDSIQPSSTNQKSPSRNESKPVVKPKQTELKKPRWRWRLWLIIILIAAVGLLAFLASRAYSLANRILENNAGPGSIGELLIASDQPLIGEEDGEIRFLLLGIGGEDHDGGTLTDTMILATLRLPRSDNERMKLGLFSIPRDLVVNIPGYEFRRINSAYAFAELAEEGSGPSAAVAVVERVTDTEIPYYGVVDFRGFEKIIDDLGGVEIDVPVGFTDFRYPDGTEGYLDPLVFEEGLQKMDGDRALKYVRSRHGNNGQGSDFARSQRQQQVISAITEKIRNLNLLFDLGLINRLSQNLADHTRTNLELHELKRLYDLTKDENDIIITSRNVGDEPGLVCDEIIEETGAYVLSPCAGLTDYSDIQSFYQTQFIGGDFAIENAEIEIQNASGTVGLASQIGEQIAVPELTLHYANLRSEAVYNEGVIYDNTNGDKPETLGYLQEVLGYRIAQSPFPFPTAEPNPDFVIVVTSSPDSTNN